mgnify:CR=1 FL=1
MKKQKCPVCQSSRTTRGSDFLICKKCGYINKDEINTKEENEKKEILL